jgi:hypothetical protein
MITISITKADVYSIAEGISVTISQHNGGAPSYEQLWASPSESRKLDIYYRQAVSDLERHLMVWAAEVHAQFDLTEAGDDYELKLSMSRWWPSRLEGLLANKIQDYLVHAITAGWLNDFDGLNVKIDYMAVAASDITDIREIIHQRAFDFEEETRTEDTDEKPGDDYDSASSRASDTDEKPGDDYDSATSRASDTDEKPGDDYDSASSRRHDSGKDMFVLPHEAGYRKKDDVRKSGPDDKPFLCRTRTDRHRDNAVVCHHPEWTDMSGTGIAYRDQMPPVPTRPMKGMGYTPAPDHHIPDPVPPYPPCPPVPPKPHPVPPSPPPYNPRKEPKVYPEPPYHAVPPHYPPFPPLPEVHPDGKEWSDTDQYDYKAEERFINSHECGHHDCPNDPFGWADEDDTTENNEQ